MFHAIKKAAAIWYGKSMLPMTKIRTMTTNTAARSIQPAASLILNPAGVDAQGGRPG